MTMELENKNLKTVCEFRSNERMTAGMHEVRREMAEHSIAMFFFFFCSSRPLFGLYPYLQPLYDQKLFV